MNKAEIDHLSERLRAGFSELTDALITAGNGMQAMEQALRDHKAMRLRAVRRYLRSRRLRHSAGSAPAPE